MWDALKASQVKWPGKNKKKFKNKYGLIDSYEGTYVNSWDTDYVYNYLDLGATKNNGTLKHPFPATGRNADGTPKSMPDAATSKALWKDYIAFVMNKNGTYNRKYGRRTLRTICRNDGSLGTSRKTCGVRPIIRSTPLRMVRACSFGFLNELDFGDEVGLVGYGQWAEQELTFYDGEVDVDISADPISDDYDTLDLMQRRRQAGEYDGWTAMGDGILKARELLVGAADDPDDDGYSRYGSRPTMLIMTDGQTNQKPDGWSMPSGFNWSEWTDYDDDGSADYSTGDSKKQYAFWEATQAIERGITLHTMAVGQGADRDLMRAIAFAGNGIYIDVPGGSTVEDLEDQLLDAFRNVAAQVPAAKLVYELSSE